MTFADVWIADAVESASRAPQVLVPGVVGHQTLWDSRIEWRMANPLFPPEWVVAYGESAEILAEHYGIDREAQDAFALGSHRAAAAAWAGGDFADEIVTIPWADLTRDEGVTGGLEADALAGMEPLYRIDGSVTAGNTAVPADGAAAVLVADGVGLDAIGTKPLARIAARAVTAVEPQWFGTGAVEAATLALRRAGIGWGDVGTIELAESSAAAVLACLSEWKDVEPALVNPSGGSIAIGDPAGATGARMVATLAWRMRFMAVRWGLAAMSIGAGQGLAIVLEGTGSSGER